MPKVFSVEEESVSLPILCLYGDGGILIEEIVKQHSSRFRIIVIDEKKAEYLEDFPSVYFLTYKDSSLFPKLQERIDYALIFIDTDNTQKFLPSVMTKLTEDKAQIVFSIKVFSLLRRMALVNEYKHFPTVKFALLGELLDRKRAEEGGVLPKIIHNAIVNREVVIAEDGMTSVFPISVGDSLTGLFRLLFGNLKNSVVYNIFYQHPQTVSAVAHIIGRHDDEIKILFSESKSPSFTISRDELREVVATRLKLDHAYLDASYEGFEKSLVKLLEEKEEIIAYASDRKRIKKKKKKKKQPGSVSKAISFSLLSLFFGTFLFLFINLAFFGAGLWYLKSAVSGVETNNFKTVVSDSKKAKFFLTSIKPSANASFELLGILGLDKKAQQGYMLLERVVELSEVAGNTFSTFFSQTPLSAKSITTTVADFTYLYREGQRIGLETNNSTLTNQLKQTYSKFLSFSEVLPTILGFDGEKNYLLLFQNDEELRPTGGFIGSIGKLRIKDGKVENLEIQDVYELDGQLKNHIEPPPVVRRYLQPHLYLRDSNFYLNYQETASMAAYIYNLETQERPDAVIAINLEVLKKIMEIVGPINIPSENVTVNASNISTYIQNTIKENFFPGSTGKKDILNTVLNQIIEKTLTDKNTYVQIVKLLPDLLEEKNILVSFSDGSIQKVFSANNYAGEFLDYRKVENRKINDFLYVNEANIGVNKVNAFVERDISYQSMLAVGRLMSKATINIQNSSTVDAYTAYYTVVVPRGSSLSSISINGTPVKITPAITDFKVYEAQNFEKPEGLEVEQYQKDQHAYFSFIISVDPGKKSAIEVAYNNGAAKDFSTVAKYSLRYIKQPGTSPYDLTLTLDYPEEYSPINTIADSYGKNFLKETTTIRTDHSLEVELQKTSGQ